MSVGAGSIKRAAKAVNTNVIVNPTEEVKEVVEKAATKKATTKSTATKSTTKKSAAKPADEKKTEYEAYGIGQQLPVHLM